MLFNLIERPLNSDQRVGHCKKLVLHAYFWTLAALASFGELHLCTEESYSKDLGVLHSARIQCWLLSSISMLYINLNESSQNELKYQNGQADTFSMATSISHRLT